MELEAEITKLKEQNELLQKKQVRIIVSFTNLVGFLLSHLGIF